MMERIGIAAGRVWRALGREGKSSVTSISKSTELEPNVVAMALGWLAREGKVVFTTEGAGKAAGLRVDLVESERQAFHA